MNIEQQLIELESYLSGLAKQVLFIAQQRVKFVEVNIQQSIGMNVHSRMAKLEQIEFNNDCVLTLTVFHKGCKGFASTSNFSDRSIHQTVNAAIDVANYTNIDPFAGLADKKDLDFNPPKLALCYPRELSVEQAIAQVIDLEKQALINKKIKQSEGASYFQHVGIRIYANSHGLFSVYNSSRYSFGLSLIAESDQSGQMVRDGFSTVARDYTDLLAADRLIDEATNRTINKLDAKRLVTQKSPVLFNSETARTLFRSFAAAVSGGNLYRKNSFLLDKLGEPIFPDWLNIHEDPFLAKGLASAPHDAEGVKIAPLDIISKGILKSYLLDSYSARKLNSHTTGHAGGIYNWFIQSDTTYSFDELLKKMGSGLVITDLMGSGVNMITGDYSRGASGYWVENGEIHYPVHEITIAGDLKTMFKNITALGKDVDENSALRTGSLLINELQIAGN